MLQGGRRLNGSVSMSPALASIVCSRWPCVWTTLIILLQTKALWDNATLWLCFLLMSSFKVSANFLCMCFHSPLVLVTSYFKLWVLPYHKLCSSQCATDIKISSIFVFCIVLLTVIISCTCRDHKLDRHFCIMASDMCTAAPRTEGFPVSWEILM